MKFFTAILMTTVLGLGACARAPKRPDVNPNNPQAENQTPTTNQTPYGPEPAPSGAATGTASDTGGTASTQPIPQYGPEAQRQKPITIIAGPGMARAFALAGVLRALEDARIPIGAIYATEMSGLVAGLYSLTKSANQFEWALMRLKDEYFERRKVLGIFGGDSSLDGKDLKDALDQILGSRDLAEGRIPIFIGMMDNQKRFVILNRGSAAEILRASCSVPGYMKTTEIFGMGELSPKLGIASLLIDEAKRNMGDSFPKSVLVLDLTHSRTRTPPVQESQKELKDYLSQMHLAFKNEDLSQMVVIKPDLTLVDFTEFSKRPEAVFRAKKLTSNMISEIKQRTR